MEDIGRQLREAREKLGLTLDEVHRATRIRPHHLEALERGDLGALPSFVQARGFLHNYADFLGLDAEALMLRFADAIQSRSGRRRAQRVSGDSDPIASLPHQPGRLKRWFSTDLFISAALVLTVLLVLVWGASRLMSVMRQQTEAASRPDLASAASATPSPTLTRTPTVVVVVPAQDSAEPAATAEATLEPLIAPVSGVQLRILGQRRSWISVRVDGDERFTGMINTGDILEYRAQDVVEIATGNAGGVRVFFNGQDQGAMGDVGQVIIRLWTRDGMVTPTPTESPTPTQSVTPSRTPIPSATPRPTRTPVPSRTPLGG
jgi:cytoskeletal protein RodZ